MKKEKINLKTELVTLVVFAIFASAAALAETVEIASAADWDNFANRVNNGERGLNAKMTRDVTLSSSSPQVGDSTGNGYSGDFDGNGKTLTVAFKTSGGSTSSTKLSKPPAPFAFTRTGSHIHDLHVAGTVETDGYYASSIVGATWFETRLTRCRSSATVIVTRDGAAYAGGLVGRADDAAPLKMTDCLFDGSILGSSATDCGGLVGDRYSSTRATVSNCLFAPENVGVGEGGNYTLVRSGFYSDSDLSNSYYTVTLGTAQGTDASGMSAADLAAALGDAWTVRNGKVIQTVFANAVQPASDPAPPGDLAFTYAGVLRDAKGNKVPGTDYTIEFRLYDQATGGSPHWGCQLPVKLDDYGLFNVEISDVSATNLAALAGVPNSGLADVLAKNAGATLYLGLKVVGTDGEIMPRQKLLASPYATYASDTGGASGDFSAQGAVAVGLATVSGTVDAKTAVVDGAATAESVAVGGTIEAYGTIPVGGIVVWSGSQGNIPSGWTLCNGQTVNGRTTPDLRDRFIVATGSAYSLGATGGADKVTLTTQEIPAHTHELWGRSSGYALVHNNSHEVITYKSKDWGSMSELINDTESTGGGEAHENRPPFYALCYIMRVK